MRLKPKYKLGLLTNSPSPFVRDILKRYQLGDLFHSIIISSEIGCAKPDLKIYEEIVRSLAVDVADALMIDDNPVNVAGAIAAGMGGLVYHSFDQLKLALSEWNSTLFTVTLPQA